MTRTKTKTRTRAAARAEALMEDESIAKATLQRAAELISSAGSQLLELGLLADDAEERERLVMQSIDCDLMVAQLRELTQQQPEAVSEDDQHAPDGPIQ